MTAGRPPGLPKTGGRIRGKSLDKGARQLVTSEMAGDLMAVYKKLGGVKWLLKFAEDNPAEFLRQGLSRLFPAPQKDDGDIQINQQFNTTNLSDREAAVRVAYALSKSLYGDPSLAVEHERAPMVDVTPEPVFSPTMWTPPSDAPDMMAPDQARWASEIPLTSQERADNALIRETKDCSITNYHGGPGEQGGSVQRQTVERDPRAAQRERMRRRKELL